VSKSRFKLIRKHPAIAGFAIAALVALSVLGAAQLGWLERSELVAHDHFTHAIEWAAGGERSAPRVAVVEVTEEDIQNLGSYPVSDDDLSRVIETVSEAGARAIGIDIYRDIPVPPGSERLEAIFRTHPRTVVVSKFADAGASGVGPPPVLVGTEQVGFNNMVIDSDGKVRRGLLYMEDGHGGVGTSLSLQLALLYLHDEGIYPAGDPEDESAVVLGASRLHPLTPRFGGYGGVDTGGFQYALDYRGAPTALPLANLTEVLSGQADPAIFRDRIVMVGVSAESLTDRFRIPSGSTRDATLGIPGAELHGRMAGQLVRLALGEAAPLRALAEWHEAALVVAFAFLGAALMLWIRASWLVAALVCGGLLGLWLGGFFALQRGVWVPVVAPAGAWVASFSLVAAYSRSRERAERGEIMQLFSRHVTRSVAEDVWRHRDEYLEGGRPRPFRVTATILFIDIKGYTGNVEKMDPAELMEWITSFLGAMAQEVLDRGGMVEDYFGDGMMACYGIPVPRGDPDGVREDAKNAVVSALGMERALHRLNDEWRAEGRPSVGIRVGICTGAVVAGSMGSADRLKYGVVGDAVVTAQRLESLGTDRVEHDFEKQPARILISDETRAQLDPTFHTECVGEFIVKGKHQPVTVHRVIGRSASEADDRPGPSGGSKP